MAEPDAATAACVCIAAAKDREIASDRGGQQGNSDVVKAAIAKMAKIGGTTTPPTTTEEPAAKPTFQIQPRITMYRGRQWPEGAVIPVKFKGGTPWQRQKVRDIAPEWAAHAFIQFEFVDEDEEEFYILVGFDANDGDWSAIGTNSLLKINNGEVSMNLEGVNPNQSEAEVRNTILHEFGHALGAGHEHQSPHASIQWNKEYIYWSLMPKYTKEKIDENYFGVDTLEKVTATKFDIRSVMLYRYPREYTLDGRGTPLNSRLSKLDKSYIRSCYPGR